MSLLRPAAVAVTAVAVTAAMAAGAVVPAAAAEPTASVVVALRTADPAALTALAHATGLSPAARHARLAALVPGTYRHADVGRRAAALGLRVTHSEAWSMTVSGPVSAVRAAFGSVSAPSRPASLAASAVAVLPARGHVAYPLSLNEPAATTGDDLRTAYAAPTPAKSAAQGFTIATVQLSGWHSGDLATYGNTFTPKVTPAYTAVSINGANPNQSDGQHGDAEVALDQETLLAVAPAAAQRAYFAPNDDGGSGFVASVRTAGTDASTHHIAALSISWGVCESAAGSQFMNAMDQALQVANAAGVTVFAASGDAGSSDCIDTTGSAAAAVDYPGSSPLVVAVGGTTLPSPSTPSTWTGWWGSGGGESTRYALPSWQQRFWTKSPHGRRLLPDISSDANPADGVAVLDTVPSDKNLWWNQVGGTSLGAPTQAALLTGSLASAGWTTGGVGDLHPALYGAAAADPTSFADITSGSNGAYAAGRGYDLVTGLGAPQWSALVSWLGSFSLAAPAGTRSTTVALTVTTPVGYHGWSAPVVNAAAACTDATNSSPPTSADLGTTAADGPYTISVAGLDNSATNGGAGACHVMQTTVVLDRVAPTAGASVRPASATTAFASWSSGDASPSSGRSTYSVTITDGAGTLYSTTTLATSVTFTASKYRSYHVNVVAVDPAGNRSHTAVANLYDDTSLTFGSGWQSIAASGYFRGSRHVTTLQNGVASMAGTGSVFLAYVTTCPTCGKLDVYIGNTLVRVISMTTNRTHILVPETLYSSTRAAKRTLSLRAKHASTTETSVQLDAAVIK
jgi:hypothetical protein